MTRRMGALLGSALWAGAGAAAAFETRVPFAPTPEDKAAVQALTEMAPTAFAEGRFTAPDGTVLPYRLASPQAPEGAGAVPLVVLLHGAGSMGTDNRAHLAWFIKAWVSPDLAARFPAYLVAPQVADRSAAYHRGEDGLLAASPGPSWPALLALVETLTRTLPVDPERVYLVGYSMGASAALVASAAEPGRFAGAVAFSGVPPERSLAGRAAATPVLLIHGTADEDNPYPAARAWAAALQAASGRPAALWYEGMGHEVPPDTALAAGWRAWLFGQRAGTPHSSLK